ncbi:transporter substrate-binding domain-containing protein [Kineococcus rhizosphaerae]|uniref:Amino acid ABC transporter substrate-binding protein (PAAT family) n=1 Tax=Kineococcus rhizosphaerae TaxID=559628 RepID=A0A2T0R4G4_9ACTN|nr:transporter substrate-binding domain-containing protein [Kineococcus rhizosphaerae]PRY15234.1 amino acid ABC transporter substrate-binding protein (PAAT family) [Kineococcus rhizosphaerae]
MSRATALLAATTVLPLPALTGCGGQAATSAAPARPSADLQLVTPGTLTVAVDATYAPMEYQENGRVAGANIDLLTDLAHRLGLTPTFVQTPFASLRDQAAAHQVDLAGSSITDKASRQTNVDFVDAFHAGEQLIAAAGSTAVSADPMSWCGRTGAASEGSTDADIVHGQSGTCVAAGEAPIGFVDVPFTDSAGEVLAGRADFGVEGLPAAAELVADSGGKLQAVGQPWQAAPWGYAVAEDRTALRDALQRALQDSIADGTYDAVLEKHGVQDGALHTAAINGGA